MGLRKREYIHEETLITAENLNDIQDAVIALEDGLFSVDNTVSGEEITITDAYKRGFRSLSIYGKTTQDGTPTPDNPVDLVNIGDSGSITVNVSSKNEEQSVTIATPNGLPGIPVPSGGNYTDANGQQWICDEIDLAKGVYIQRIHTETVTLENIDNVDNSNASGAGAIVYVKLNNQRSANDEICLIMCDRAFGVPFNNRGDWADEYRCYVPTGNAQNICLRYPVSAMEKTLEDAQKDFMGCVICYVALAPIETPLSAEEIAAHASLHTYRDNTTVSNDAGAYMELEYVMDSKKYIDSKIASSILTATVE